MSDYLPILSLIVSAVGAFAVPLVMYVIRQLNAHGETQAAHGARLDAADKRGDRHSRELAAVRDDVEGLKRSAA